MNIEIHVSFSIMISSDYVPSSGIAGSYAGLDGKKSTCNAGDPSSIPGLGRSPGEGIDYPLQYSRTSLVAQRKKNLPVMQEIWVQYLN